MTLLSCPAYYVNNAGDIDGLPAWLEDRTYNEFSRSRDGSGNPMIGLRLYDPKGSRRNFDRAGVVVCKKWNLVDQVIALIKWGARK
jgi:hypothetical protein